jgi:hypothetical protein
MPSLKQIGFGLVTILVLFFGMLIRNWYSAKLRAAKQETAAVVSFHQSELKRETGKQGQQLATQPKVEVGKNTFRNLTEKRIRAMEKESGLDMGNVSTLTETTVTTQREIKAPLTTDTLNGKTGATDSFPILVRRFHIRTRFGTMAGQIRGDSITIRDSVANPITLLETRPKWKLRHLWPWNWGTRKREVKLLIHNPDSRIDTLTNISVIP